jgi:hypothetical protein
MRVIRAVVTNPGRAAQGQRSSERSSSSGAKEHVRLPSLGCWREPAKTPYYSLMRVRLHNLLGSVVLCSALFGCNRESASGPRAPEASAASDSTVCPCAAAAPPANAPPVPAPEGKRAPCTYGADQTCNDDPTISSLWGTCTQFGVCECKPGFELSPETKRCRARR